MPGARAKLMLLSDGEDSKADLDALRDALSALPGFDEAELEPNGRSTVTVLVPARNQRERERLKALVNARVDGWRVVDERGYGLPATF